MLVSKHRRRARESIAAVGVLLAALAYLSGCPRGAAKDKDAVVGQAGDASMDASSRTGPPHKLTISCTSPDGKYGVTLRFATPTSSSPSHADVAIGGRPPLDSAETTGVTSANSPGPGTLTCSSNPDSSAFCHVAGTSDYGYIAKVSTVGGRYRVELLKNGVASTWLAIFDCPE
jgi:hypothetical protein